MKTSKHRRITPSSSSAAFERDARREIEHFKRALNSYADRFARGKRMRGASTITQQTAKNVFLWPGRDWKADAPRSLREG